MNDLLQELRRLQKEQAAVIERIAALSLEGTAAVKTEAEGRAKGKQQDDKARDLALGDRVRITNKVKIPGRATNPNDTIGVIEHITRTRVRIQTDGGTVITRAPSNVSFEHAERRTKH